MTPDGNHRVTSDHLDREAVVYVRQSTIEQVRDHSESTRIQLGLREKAIALGWANPRIIDDDLGVSAGGYAHRPGFRNLLTRVAMREIGIILCVDASRLSRNSKDWAHLFELCNYFKTLIADTEQIYDLSHPNDRMVMGIKGTVTEMELGLIRSRMRSGVEAKAHRGELQFQLPVGYVHDPEGRIVFDPDQRVQKAVLRLFERFERCTSIRQLSMWCRDTKTTFPIRGPDGKGDVRWQIPKPRTLYNHLLHPVYAGAYVWGRRTTKVEYIDGELVKRTCVSRPDGEAQVCLRDHHPGYITWERHMAIREKLAHNRPRWKMDENMGAIREGLALLAGLLRCGRCGGKVYVHYKGSSALYYCDGGEEKGSRRCAAFGSYAIDRKVSEELLRACSPLAIEAAERAVQQREAAKSAAMEAARLQLQSAEYEADHALEQFDLCDPKNRLVADTLETRLNEKLNAVKEAKERLAADSRLQDAITETQRERLAELARDLPAVWNHPKADPRLKKRLLRAAIHEIVVNADRAQRRVEVTVHWQGGAHTKSEVALPFRSTGGATDPDLTKQVGRLAAALSDAEIARILNMKGETTPRGMRWTRERVSTFRKQHGIKSGERERNGSSMTMSQAMEHLGVSHNCMLALARKGLVSPNQITDFAPWRVSKEELDSERVQAAVRLLKDTGRLPKGGSPENQPTLFDQNTEKETKV
jgi:DNA invertase Pin-like site-specific DNA recombinase